MTQIIIASNNQGKIKDFQVQLTPLGFDVKGLADLNINFEVEETGKTFEENAILKAVETAKFLNLPVIADDSGLVVPALNGQPGVYSARFAGEPKSDERNNQKLLELMTNQSQRYAYFECVLALAMPNGKVQIFTGRCEGEIAEQLIGDEGFGYDPLFYLPQLSKTMAQLKSQEKAQLSHRGQAMKQLLSSINLKEMNV